MKDLIKVEYRWRIIFSLAICIIKTIFDKDIELFKYIFLENSYPV